MRGSTTAIATVLTIMILGSLKDGLADEAEDWFNRGNKFQEEDQLLEAIEAYQRSIKINPRYWVAHHNLGLALKKTRQFQKAVDAFQGALKLVPNNLDIHLNLGNLYNYLENWGVAIQHLNRVVHRRQNDAVAHGNLGWALYNYKRGPPFKLLVILNLRKSITLFEAQNESEAAEATRKTLEEVLMKYSIKEDDLPLW